MNRGERFARNVGWGLAGQGAVAAINLLVIPRLVRGFGVEAYGLYLLMQAAAGWIGALHFGAGAGLVRFAAQAHAEEKPGALDDSLRHAAWLIIGGAAAGAVVLWAAAPLLVGRVFVVPEYYQAHGAWMIRAAALGAVFSSVAAWAGAAFQGLHRFHWQSAAAVLQGVLIPFGVLGALALGRGLGAASAGFVAVHAFVAVFCVYGVARARRAVHGHGGHLSFRRFWDYSIGFWPSALAQLVSGQLDRAFVAGLRSMSEFTLYAVPASVLSRVQSLPATASAALVPVMGGLADDEHPDTPARLYLRASRVLIGLLIPAYALLFCLMPQFLSLWLGGDFGDASVWPARLLVAAQTFALFSYLPVSVAAGRKDGWWVSAAAWLQALICLALWPWMIPRWGLLGAAFGGMVAQAVSTLALATVVHGRLLRLSWTRFVEETSVPASAGAAVLLAVAWPLRVRVTGWVSFFALCAAARACYTIVFWRLLPSEDRKFLRQRLPF
ncbi:MAG: oligosaccharide flippase family protein [Elusimicrobiota bacterium]|nr:MAG: oligosaccharide flippase family protein [Elusimicrobiota bacterium]